MLVIPTAMQKALFALQYPEAPRYADQVAGFLTFLSLSARGEVQKAAEEAMFDIQTILDERDTLGGLLVLMFDDVVYLQCQKHAEQPANYFLRVCGTLDNDLATAFELDGVVNMDFTNKAPRWQQQCVLEYFDRSKPYELLQAIECRVGIPAYMYTGLDNKGTNGTHDK
ncbi:hypothetical protein MZD04_gp145 [Pseudomonas phage Psa21]|uniref:Uncharacterized protein n=1 Tax=Pseudomonas phage Psa21 TaxID=2530023 RepID=A0A481W4U0_9CAUD|nr:hypothetical protein MZD04_gp145 [Pseudomonas phage Psa21]QBJ02672.1 hypothetical protein PSA21_145 [Pseudomonas phage Psa21]